MVLPVRVAGQFADFAAQRRELPGPVRAPLGADGLQRRQINDLVDELLTLPDNGQSGRQSGMGHERGTYRLVLGVQHQDADDGQFEKGRFAAASRRTHCH